MRNENGKSHEHTKLTADIEQCYENGKTQTDDSALALWVFTINFHVWIQLQMWNEILYLLHIVYIFASAE